MNKQELTINQNNAKKRILKGGIGFFASNIASKGLGFLFVVTCTRLLGVAEFGVYSLGFSVFGIVTNIGAFGLPNIIQRFLSGEGEKRVKKIYGSILCIAFFTAIFFSVGLYLWADYISSNIFNQEKLSAVLRLFSIAVFFTVSLNIARAVLQAQEKIKPLFIGTTVLGFVKLMLLILFFLLTRSSYSPVLAYIFATFLVSIYMLKCLLKIQFKPEIPEKKDIKRVLNYSVPLVFVGFSYFLMQQTDRLMIGWLTTSKNVGIYTAISTLALVISAFHSSLVSIFKPVASQAYRKMEIDDLNTNYLFISKWIGCINGIVILFFATFGFWLLSIFGAEYANIVSYEILLLLSILYFISAFLGPTGALLQMTDGHKIELYNTLIFLVLNIILNYFLILRLGIIGAALGTLISGITRNILQIVEIKLRLNITAFDTHNLNFLAICSISLLLCYTFYDYKLYIFLISIIVIVLHKIFSIDNDEKELLYLVIKKNKKLN